MNLESQGRSPDEIDHAILDMISSMHLIVALCFCDLYCFQLNPNHSPQLFEFLLSREFPDVLRPWSDYFRINLEEVQEQILEKMNTLREMKERQFDSRGSRASKLVLGALGVGAILMLGMCSQLAPNTTYSDTIYPDVDYPDTIYPSPNAASQGLIVIVKNSANANIRTGPSESSAVILTVPPGFETSVKSIDTASGWIEIDMTNHHPSYQTGWVFSDLVDLYEIR